MNSDRLRNKTGSDLFQRLLRVVRFRLKFFFLGGGAEIDLRVIIVKVFKTMAQMAEQQLPTWWTRVQIPPFLVPMRSHLKKKN